MEILGLFFFVFGVAIACGVAAALMGSRPGRFSQVSGLVAALLVALVLLWLLDQFYDYDGSVPSRFELLGPPLLMPLTWGLLLFAVPRQPAGQGHHDVGLGSFQWRIRAAVAALFLTIAITAAVALRAEDLSLGIVIFAAPPIAITALTFSSAAQIGSDSFRARTCVALVAVSALLMATTIYWAATSGVDYYANRGIEQNDFFLVLALATGVTGIPLVALNKGLALWRKPEEHSDFGGLLAIVYLGAVVLSAGYAAAAIDGREVVDQVCIVGTCTYVGGGYDEGAAGMGRFLLFLRDFLPPLAVGLLALRAAGKLTRTFVPGLLIVVACFPFALWTAGVSEEIMQDGVLHIGMKPLLPIPVEEETFGQVLAHFLVIVYPSMFYGWLLLAWDRGRVQ